MKLEIAERVVFDKHRKGCGLKEKIESFPFAPRSSESVCNK